MQQVYGPTRPCAACGAAVQAEETRLAVPRLYDSGTRRRHSCGVVSWCSCGTPVYTRTRDGLRCDVADDRAHACRDLAARQKALEAAKRQAARRQADAAKVAAQRPAPAAEVRPFRVEVPS